jgi:hypothetical protein
MTTVMLGKFMRAKEFAVDPPGKTRHFSVENITSNAQLGTVQWYSPWRRYCYEPLPGITLDATCLRLLSIFLDEITKKQARGNG